MDNNLSLQIFGNKQIRYAWDSDEEKWYFSIVDVVGILTEQPTVERARNYWKVLKNRLKKEGNQSVTSCNQLKLPASDGKLYKTDVADQEQLFRLIQSIPSPKAEPIKQWIARVASERIDESKIRRKPLTEATSTTEGKATEKGGSNSVCRAR